jgi:ATP-dependent exoDNAse (exonuclease V) beta subunit
VRLEEVLCRVADPLERFVREGEYRNVLRFIDELLAAERAGECSGSVLSALQWLGARRLSGASAPDANQRTSDVVLTTVHGSKGLEYPMVILPFLEWGARQSDDFLVGERDGATVIGLRVEDDDHKRTSTLLSRWLNEHRRLRECAEERRVFYVGCTRAQEYLVLFRPAPKKNQSEDSAKPSLWLELLIPQAGEEAGAE